MRKAPQKQLVDPLGSLCGIPGRTPGPLASPRSSAGGGGVSTLTLRRGQSTNLRLRTPGAGPVPVFLVHHRYELRTGPLPGDRAREQRPPSLVREGAQGGLSKRTPPPPAEQGHLPASPEGEGGRLNGEGQPSPLPPHWSWGRGMSVGLP